MRRREEGEERRVESREGPLAPPRPVNVHSIIMIVLSHAQVCKRATSKHHAVLGAWRSTRAERAWRTSSFCFPILCM